MIPDSEGLQGIANTKNRDRRADIVFIHGLCGASHTTWRHGKDGVQGHFFWPEELGKDLPHCGIWTVGYPAGLTELGEPGMIIEDRANNISFKLANNGLGDRPLFLVTHSMGGLVVKSLIVCSQTLPGKDRRRIVNMVGGIVFCGVPHRGSEFADAAVVLGKFFGGSQPHVREMRRNAGPLNTLHNEFIEWHSKNPVPLDSYAENCHLFRKRTLLRPLFLRLNLVVPPGSADPNIVGHTVHGVDEDHLTLVKPPDRKHDVYAGVLRFIQNALMDAPPPPDSTTVVAPVGPRKVTVGTPVVREPVFESAQDGFDVFISYSSLDKAWVRGELLQRIEGAGLKAFIDFRDFTRGAPSIKECERGVEQCRKTLLILTPNYIASGWGEIENIMVQTLDPANRELRLIPLLKKECKKPLRIGALTHIDFTDGADFDLAWRQLLTALGKPPEPEPPKEPKRDDWFLAHPYPMPPNFTGRVDERKMLTGWLDTDAAHPLLSLRALGGFGKSALAWHWLTHDVKPTAWPRVVWWSFYEGDASFDNFVERTVSYLKAGNPAKLGPRQRIDALLKALHQPGTLLVLDGFERTLRAFGGLNAAYQGDEAVRTEASDCDCISPLAEAFLRGVATLPDIHAKVLLTTRLRPAPVETRGGILLCGCREEELTQLQPADAVEFFHAQGIRGTRAEIEQACEPYGYHPLSLRLLAGLIVGDFEQPGDIAAARHLDVSGDLKARQHHVLEQSYNGLTPVRQKLLSRIACFRTPVRYDALKALAETAEESGVTLNTDLRDLVVRGLLHHDAKEGRFDLHPIVRRYAYDRLAAPDRSAAHTRLRDYFAAVPKPDKVTRLEDLAPVIELYHHTVRAGQFDEARTLFRDRLSKTTYYQFGAYQLRIDLLRALFPDGENRPPRLKDKGAQAWTLNSLANSYSLSGQPGRAMPLYERVNDIYENKTKNKGRLAIGLGNLACMAQMPIGALRAAEANLRRRIALCREIKHEQREGTGLYELGRLLAYTGQWSGSSEALDAGEKIKKRTANVQAQGIIWGYRALRELLRLRSASQSSIRNSQSAIGPACRALELADETARTQHPYEIDYIRAHWLLGAAHRVAGQHDEAERHLHEALERCRRINLVEAEADILIDLARLHAATGAPDEARRLVEEALLITERSGYVLQGADARLELAKLALARGDKATALDHVKEARRLATCDGPPDYTYKAAYDEAGALLTELQS